MQTRYLYLLRMFLPVVDLIMLNAVYCWALYILDELVQSDWQIHYLIVCNLLWLICSLTFGLYTEYSARAIERIYRATWKASVMHGFIFSFYFLYSEHNEFYKRFFITFYGWLFIACLLNRFIGTVIQYILIKRFRFTKKVAVMGNNYTAARLKQFLKRQRNITFYGFIGSHDGKFMTEDGLLSNDTIQQISVAVNEGVKDLYVCIPPEIMSEIKPLISEADRQLIRLKFIPDMGGAIIGAYSMRYLGGEFPIITVRNEPLEAMGNRFKKRSFDLVFSLLVMILLLSWLYPIIALLIKLDSKGPVLFRQQRSGRDDKPFWCYKFRSMQMNTQSSTLQATRGDSRITKIGKFLRETSLDELPQFINVLQGHMSVVGPRPHMIKHTEQYRAIVGRFMVRHFAKPGITGWAQVNGFRGETKSPSDMERRVEHDIYYLENWSLMWDIRIVFLTIINVVRGEENAF